MVALICENTKDLMDTLNQLMINVLVSKMN